MFFHTHKKIHTLNCVPDTALDYKFGVCCKFSGFALVCSVWSLILNPNMVLLCRSYFCLYHFVLHAGYVLSILLRIINCINFGFIAIEKLYLVILVF